MPIHVDCILNGCLARRNGGMACDWRDCQRCYALCDAAAQRAREQRGVERAKLRDMLLAVMEDLQMPRSDLDVLLCLANGDPHQTIRDDLGIEED